MNTDIKTNLVDETGPHIALRLTERLHLGKPADMQWLDVLISEGLDQLPRPGGGETLCRWQALAAVAAFDLSLAKLYEGHTDALAILAELAPTASGHGTSTDGPRKGPDSWGVWAAEAPGGRTMFKTHADGTVLLHGAKFWCSGALTAKHALLTAWDEEGTGPQLIRLNLRAPGITVDATKWCAIGMGHSASVKVLFENTRAQRVGTPGDYLRRPGFWQGGAGIAACWFGGACGLAEALRLAVTEDALPGGASGASAFLRTIALGQVDLALRSTAAILREAAEWVDRNPLMDASEVALRSRLSAEQCAKIVLDAAGRALGAAPFCLDEKFSQAAADLPVFIRQSHAERDLAALGERVAAAPQAWAL